MFSWVCSRCGHEVPPSKTECPFCTPPAPEAAAPQTFAPPPLPPPPYQAPPPSYAPPQQAPQQQAPQQAPQYWQPQGSPPPAQQYPPQYGQQAPPQYWQQPQYPPQQYPPQQYPPQQYQPVQEQPPQQYQAPPPQQEAPPLQHYQPPPPPPQYTPAPSPPAQSATPWPPPEEQTGKPAWLVGLLAFAGVLALLGLVYFVMGSHSSSAAKDAAKQQTTNPLQKYIEVVGLRIVGAKSGEQVRFLVVNHGGDELSGLTANVTLYASTQRSEEDSVGTFTFKIDSLAPNDSKELTAPLKTDKGPADMPDDWRNITADVQISSAQ